MTDFAFLRAVNLGKRNKVPMKQLMSLIAASGLGPAEYMLASGNLIFPDGAASTAGPALRKLIREEFQVDTDVFVRPTAALQELVAMNPFGIPETGSVQIAIWDDAADREGLDWLTETDHGNDQLQLLERAAVIRYGSSSHDSKLSGATLTRRLGLPNTIRNVKTFVRLLERYGTASD